MTPPFSGSGNSATNNLPSLMGIWRIGPVLHSNDAFELTLAQPADAPESPRWEYLVKRLAHGVDQPRTKADLSRTIEVAAEVQHPNLVTVLDGTSTGTFPYAVMPRLRGQTMHALMQHAERKPLPAVLWLARQAAQAIAAMHAKGWVHADVSPTNLMVDDSGHVTVVDLASAHRVGTPCKASQVDGDFASPELQTGDALASPAVDVFALGRLLWQWMLRLQIRDESSLHPVATLVEQMIDPDDRNRPLACEVVATLLQIELRVLSQHIGPVSDAPIRRAA